MPLIQKGKTKIFAGRKIKILGLFFVCLFMMLVCIRDSEAKSQTKAQAKTMAAKIRIVLTSKPWTIYVSSRQVVKGVVKSSVKEDILTFTETTVTSESLSAQEYSKGGSAYSVKINPAGDTYIWETVMLHENQKDIVLLKGELKNGVMAGIIIYQPQGAPAKTYNFTTIRQK